MAAKKWMAKARRSMERRGTTGALGKKDPTPGSKGLSDADLRTLWARAGRTGDKTLMKQVQFAAGARGMKLGKAKEK
jgi:hypothetical protein